MAGEVKILQCDICPVKTKFSILKDPGTHMCTDTQAHTHRHKHTHTHTGTQALQYKQSLHALMKGTQLSSVYHCGLE